VPFREPAVAGLEFCVVCETFVMGFVKLSHGILTMLRIYELSLWWN